MNEIKIGSKVKVVKAIDKDSLDFLGQVGEVIDITRDVYDIKFEISDGYHFEKGASDLGFFIKEELEIIEEKKI